MGIVRFGTVTLCCCCAAVGVPTVPDSLRQSCDEYVAWARAESQRLADLAGSRRDVGGVEYARRARELRDRLQGCLACGPLFGFYGGSRCVVVVVVGTLIVGYEPHIHE